MTRYFRLRLCGADFELGCFAGTIRWNTRSRVSPVSAPSLWAASLMRLARSLSLMVCSLRGMHGPISGRHDTLVTSDDPAVGEALIALCEGLRVRLSKEDIRVLQVRLQVARDRAAVSRRDAGFPVDLPTLRRRMADYSEK